jgi:hypothetical protein
VSAATGWLRARPRAVLAVTTALLAFTTWLDYITGYEFGFFIFYFVPVSSAAWLVGRRAGVVFALASGCCWFLSDRLAHHPYSNAFFIYWETAMRLASYLTTALTLARIRADTVERERLGARLAAAEAALRGPAEPAPPSAA